MARVAGVGLTEDTVGENTQIGEGETKDGLINMSGMLEGRPGVVRDEGKRLHRDQIVKSHVTHVYNKRHVYRKM